MNECCSSPAFFRASNIHIMFCYPVQMLHLVWTWSKVGWKRLPWTKLLKMPRERTLPVFPSLGKGGCSWPHASKLLSDGWSTKSPQACTNQARLKGALNLREASEGTSVWTFRGLLLTPGGYFLAAVERPFRVFWELLFFSNESCPFTCLSFRQQPPGKWRWQQQRICTEQQGQEFSQENAPSFCSLIFHSILLCLKGLSGATWGNELFENVILAQIFWKKMSREKNRIVIWVK